jgi:GLPGLI family protein
MKKIVIRLFILALLPNFCFCQKAGDAKITYDVEFNTDFPIKATTFLTFNDSISQYLVFDRENIGDKYEIDVIMELKGNGVPEVMETNLFTNKISFVQNIMDETYLVNETKKKIDWTITSETKKIGNFICYKAIGIFRQRTFYVYFCPDLQSSFGPWKLNGLPGVILEAQESNNLLRIFAKQVDISKNNFSFFKIDNSFKVITLKDYVKMIDKLVLLVSEQVKLKLPRGAIIEDIGVTNNNKIEVFDETDF